MNETTVCPKCGSNEIVRHARIMDRGEKNWDIGLQVSVARRPQALLFKQSVESELFASVCAVCGFTEIYASKPRELYEAYLAAQQNQ